MGGGIGAMGINQKSKKTANGKRKASTVQKTAIYWAERAQNGWTICNSERRRSHIVAYERPSQENTMNDLGLSTERKELWRETVRREGPQPLNEMSTRGW